MKHTRPPPPARGEHWLYGRHAVAAALANPARRWRRLVALAGHEDEAAALLAAARARPVGAGERLRLLDRAGFARLLPEGAVHQGWALDAEPLTPPALDDIAAVLREVNLARGLDRLKAAGFWCCGLDEEAAAPLAALDLGPRVVLVLGSEGGGLRRLVRERCDFLARRPTRPPLTSLNVSAAAAVALYELARGG